MRIVTVAGLTGPGMLIVKDADTLLLLWDGHYYEMKRENG